MSTPNLRHAAFLACAALAFGACSSSKRRPLVPGDPDPKAAQAATKAGRWQEAANLWYAIYLEDPHGSPRPVAETARALLALKDVESADNLLGQGLQDHPKDPDLLELKAQVLIAQGFRRPAQGYLEDALAVQPARASALLAYARLCFDLRLEHKTAESLETLHALQPGTYESYALYARARRATGDAASAIAAWQQAFSIAPGKLEDLLHAASLCVDAEFLKTNPGAAALCRSWLERALSMQPQCTHAHFQLGVLSEATQAFDEAIEHYRRAVEIDPSCLQALTNLAILYSARGDEDNTRAMVGRALELEEDDDRRRELLRLTERFERPTPPPGG